MQKILKVRFDYITLKQATETAIQWSQNSDQKYITTPNPEIVLEAQKNKKFLKILNKSDLNIADGTGILWASKFLKITEKSSKGMVLLKWIISLILTPLFPSYIRTELPERVTGVDLMQNICKEASKTNIKIFLLGAADNVAEKTKEILEKKYKGVKIVGAYAGSPKENEEKEIREIVKDSAADILFIAYGAPAQEIWIHRNLQKMPNIKVAIGIGGSFDFISGMRKRAPKWMQKIGIEWLYRLLQQPKRIIRIYRAIIKFPLKILKYRL